ncbi:hypothetical protein H311_01962 [Anncaliia algerae PRA109]|nr:hypothetical protein H311_01962 [Anncaliia algerae PRA109]
MNFIDQVKKMISNAERNNKHVDNSLMLLPEQKKQDMATQKDSEEKLEYKNSETLDKGWLFRMEDQSKSNKIMCTIGKSLKEINEIINKLSEDLGYENKKFRKLLEKTKSRFEESLKFRNPAYI